MRGGQLGGGYWVSGEQGRPGWLRFMRVPGCVLRIGIRTRLLRARDDRSLRVMHSVPHTFGVVDGLNVDDYWCSVDRHSDHVQ